MRAKLGEPSGAPVAAFREQAAHTLAQLERLLARIEEHLTKAESDLVRAVGQDLHRLGKYMHFRAEQFALRQHGRLAEIPLTGLRPGFQQESFQLRAQLAEDFFTYVTDTAKQLSAKQRETENDLRHAAAETLSEIDNVLHFGFQPPGFPLPSVIPLSRTTTFDLDDFWDARQDSALMSPDEAEDFKVLVNSEFGGMIDALIKLADTALREHVAGSLRRLRFLSYSAIYPIAQQLQNFAESLHKRDVTSYGAPVGSEDFSDLFARWEDIRERCERDAAAFKDLRRQCIAMLDQ
jgi:hypothetical protein